MRCPVIMIMSLVTSILAMDICNTRMSCQDCLQPVTNMSECGWCTPKPAVWANGTSAYSCMDHRSIGWDCFNLYMQDTCVQGYTCDSGSGTCVLAPAGQGDTKGNCEKACKPPPPPGPPPPKQYECDIQKFTCVEVASGGTSQQTCGSACSKSTPSSLVGLWRGINVQANSSRGEWEMNFTASSVAWGPHGEPQKFVADVATISTTRARLILTSPSSAAGTTLYASFSTPGWPTGPETHSVTIALQKQGSHQVPPDNVVNAMGDQAFDLFVMHACNSWGKQCSFAPAFTTPPPPVASAVAKKTYPLLASLLGRPEKPGFLGDNCTANRDCGSCIHDPLSTCGWCDGVITFSDGTRCGEDGNGCCGGDSGFGHCNVTFRKECPVTCDWTNWTSPVCRPATGHEINDPKVQKFSDCALVKKYGACGNPPSPSPTPTPPSPSPPSIVFCEPGVGCQGPVNKSQCLSNPHCDPDHPTCNPTQCQQPPPYYLCDAKAAQCTSHTGTPPPGQPYYNSSDECTKLCYDNDLSGVWRGLRIDSGFVADEWDFKFSGLSQGATVTYTSKATGASYSGTYTVGAALTKQTMPSFQLKVTLSTGDVLTGLYANKDAGPVTRFLYLGLPLASGATTGDYDDAMAPTNQEFVLVSCLQTVQGCSFTAPWP